MDALKSTGAGELARVRCVHCNITRYYQPADLQVLAGDIPAAAIRMRCEKCGKGEWIRITFERLPAAQRQAIRVRRLAEIRMSAGLSGSTSPDERQVMKYRSYGTRNHL
jgi:hypothetical protein